MAGSEHVKFINLPPAGFEVPAGSKVKLSGFGNARVGGPTSNVLQKSDLFTVSHTECNTYYSTYLHKTIDDASQICAKGGSGQGACQVSLTVLFEFLFKILKVNRALKKCIF